MANLTHTWTDDDGSGTVGTIINNSQLQTVYQNTGHADAHTVGGRLTLTSGLPVTVNDVTGATTLYYTPYLSDVIALFDGSANWIPVSFAETSIGLGTLTNNLPYDVFGFNNGGSLGLELLAWSSTSARATALVYQNGVLVKTGATTRRFLGTFTTTAATTTESSLLKRHVWNYYNRVRLPLLRTENTATWTYASPTPHQANASSANQVEVTIGWQDATLLLTLQAQASNTTASNTLSSIGEDVANAVASGVIGGVTQVGNTSGAPSLISAFLAKMPTIGKHVYAWIEASGSATTTFSSNNLGGYTGAFSGLNGWIEG